MAEQVRAVFFDAGHTLIESLPSVAGIYCAAAERCGVHIAPQNVDEIFPILKKAYADITTKVMKTAVTDEADKEMWRVTTYPVYAALQELQSIDYDTWFDQLHDMFIAPDTWQPFEETIEVLQTLRRMGLRTAVVSNWSSNLPHILDARNLTGYFDAVVVSCLEGFRKPAPELFHRALERSGARPEETIHVGDSYEDDVNGARAAGIRAVLVHRGGGVQLDCTVIRDLRGVVPLVEGSTGSSRGI